MGDRSLDDRFELCLKTVNIIQRELIKMRNLPDFNKASKQVQDNVVGVIEDLQRFREKGYNYPWTDKEKKKVIQMTVELVLNLFGKEIDF